MGYLRGFFERWRYRLAVFMQGRYGPDELYRALLVAYIVLLVIQLIAGWWWLTLLEWVVLLFTLFRCFSKNIAARQRENALWLRLWRRMKESTRLVRNRWRDRRTHVYRTCPHCRAIVRLPRSKKGKRVCNCPRCRRDFSVTIR